TPQSDGGWRGARATRRPTEAWRSRYPAFPRLLIVLTGAAESRLERRAADLRSLAASDPALQHTDLRAGITTLTKLQDLGPAAPIFLPALGPAEPCDAWLRPPAAVAA
ncbi:hypothetical protein CLM83_30575, partial [Streptomyces albidoflavus]